MQVAARLTIDSTIQLHPQVTTPQNAYMPLSQHMQVLPAHATALKLEWALGTSWNRGVRRISLVRLCLGPPAVGFA